MVRGHSLTTASMFITYVYKPQGIPSIKLLLYDGEKVIFFSATGAVRLYNPDDVGK